MVISAPTEPAPTEPVVGEVEYYIVGTFNDWSIDENYKLEKNEEAETEEYVFEFLGLSDTTQFKVVGFDGENKTWYPDGMGNNYGENGEITAEGTYTLYFRPNADGGEDWFYGVIYVAANEPVEEPVLGDVDGDGKVDIFDASAIQKGLAGMEGYPNYAELDEADTDFILADIDGDGKVDVFDASLIQKWIAGDASAQSYGIGEAI